VQGSVLVSSLKAQAANWAHMPSPSSHPRMSVMRVIVLHPYTKFEVRMPPVPKMWMIFGHCVKRPGDLDLGTGAECQPWQG